MNTEITIYALGQYGLKEATGPSDNAEILKMAKDCGFDNYYHDETAWCSLFMNWVALKTGHERSGKLNARSWLTVGDEQKSPEMGDVVVLWRGDPKGWEGHVGVFVRQVGTTIYILAGNQGDMVSIQGFPQIRVLGYRTLKKINDTTPTNY